MNATRQADRGEELLAEVRQKGEQILKEVRHTGEDLWQDAEQAIRKAPGRAIGFTLLAGVIIGILLTTGTSNE
jgi:ElaB/YqjD/DUF883 family membrane-anchored ribosome-binding protein